MKFPLLLATGTALLLASYNSKDGQSDQGGSARGAGPSIAAVNYPLAYFAERLAGDFATIVFDAPADGDPAFWNPSDEAIARFQEADLILLNGASYAKWALTTTLPFETSVDTSAGFEDRFIEIGNAVKHSHGKDDDAHSHAGTAFTTWMDFKLASAQAKAVAEAIAEEWPDRKEAVLAGLESLEDDLAALDRMMTSATTPLKAAPVIASHPVYQYWERAYGLEVPSLFWEPEMELTDAAIADLEKLREAHPGATFFVWEGDPLPGHIEKLKSLGLTSLVVSPCGNRPESGDFLTVMKDNIAAIEAATK